MAKYLTEAQIRHAVEQLGRSATPRGRICAFLIGVRALKLAGETVGLAESVPEFVRAIEEFTLWDRAAADSREGAPYFNPFGNDADYKSWKFRSNGPSNTIADWASQANNPFEILGTRPKSIKRRTLSTTQLRAFLLQRNHEDYRPRLIDAAVWFYRGTDLENPNGSVPDRQILETRFISDVGLSDEDVEALFRGEEEDTDADELEIEQLGSAVGTDTAQTESEIT